MKNLVAYITTGYPSLDFTIDLAFSLKEAGVDTLELGIPFSDPVADGPIIEEANLRALEGGFKMRDLFEVSGRVASEIDTLFMGYFNPFYHIGVDRFIADAKRDGVSGFIIPDLPYEEAKEYKSQIEKEGLALIDFIAPTDPKRRVEKIVNGSKKFIYLVAYAGITGAKQRENLDRIVSDIREFSDTPIYVGFGVNEKSAKERAKGVDGVIVGSAFIKILLDDRLSNTQKIDNISKVAKSIKYQINE
ncbi:MAG: tryptophan synthase subunit alpha [Epsilonproteobacteria bacterium]|nr:tryptophan synthase subunit alpha [Campylobacterota bacterium]